MKSLIRQIGEVDRSFSSLIYLKDDETFNRVLDELNTVKNRNTVTYILSIVGVKLEPGKYGNYLRNVHD